MTCLVRLADMFRDPSDVASYVVHSLNWLNLVV